MNRSPTLLGSVTMLFPAGLLKIFETARQIVFSVALPTVLAALCPSAFSLDTHQRIDQLYHSSWSAREGVTGYVTALAQTTDGYLWVGTSDRLLRFNGVSFENYQPEVGLLGAASISALMATSDGGLWIGYTRGGATFLKNGRIKNYSDSDGFPVSTVRCFAQDAAGTIWAATVGGLARLEGSRWRILDRAGNYPYKNAWSLFVDRRGTLWVGTGSEILFLPAQQERFYDTGIQCSDACVLLQGLDGNILFYDTLAKGFRTIPQTKSPRAAVIAKSDSPVSTAIFDRDGTFWVGGNGLSRLRYSRFSPENASKAVTEKFMQSNGLSGDAVETILEDREGNIWVGTRGGLDRFRNRNVTWFPLKGGSFSLVTGPDNEVWAGSRQGAIPMVRVRDRKPMIPGTTDVYTAFHDPDGSLWLSSNHTLMHWQRGRLLAAPVPAEVVKLSLSSSPPDPIVASAITKDHLGNLWVAFGGSGEFRLENNKWTFVPVLPDHPDWSAGNSFTDSSGRIWLFWGDRIARYDGGKVRIFDAKDGLAIGPPEAMLERDQTFWAGGESGLAFLRGGQFHAIYGVGNAAFDSITGIVAAQNGDLWLSTGPGIIHIPNDEVEAVLSHPEHKVQFELFDLISDLPDPIQRTGEVYSPGAIQASDGMLWFATQHGVVRIDPVHLYKNPLPPPVSISSMAADNKAYAVDPNPTLPALTQNVVIHYDALSLTTPERVRFKYKLSAWDHEWHDAGGRREAYFTHLSPGHYSLQVIASNNDGVWNTTGATLSFTVAAAWYQTRWFYALCAATAAIALWMLYRFRLRQIAKAMSDRFDERLAERTRIARDFHDTFLQTIQGSKLVADEALDSWSDASRTRHALERLSSWLNQATDESRAALNSLRLSATVRNDLAEALERAADSGNSQGSMSSSFSVLGNPQEMHPIVRDEIFRISYEAIRNAHRHSRASCLEIELRYGHDLAILVQDNGIGIDPSITDHGKDGHFGLQGMRERAARIRGKLTIISSASFGTRVTLTVPGAIAFSRPRLSLFSRMRVLLICFFNRLRRH